MKKSFAFILFLALSQNLFSQNQAPAVKNFSATANWQSKTLSLNFDATDPENDPLEISLEFSDNGGKTFALQNQFSPSGDIGFPVAAGTGKSIVCDISSLAATSGNFTVRIVADDRQPLDIQSLVNEVDSNRLRANLQFVEGIRHRTAGTAHLNEVRDSLQGLFRDGGLFTETQSFSALGTTGMNIIGSSSGTSSPEKVVVVDAHYDTVNNAPGADDNGSGTVGVMEMAAILSKYPSKKTMRFIGFDLEEAGLLGSIRYVASGIPAGESIEGVFNFEMIGYYSEEPNSQEMPAGFEILFPAAYLEVESDQFRGNFITNVGNVASQTLIDLFQNSAKDYAPGLKSIPISVPGNGTIVQDLRRSDHTPFWDSGRKALMITDGANFRNECYHTPGDTASEKLNFTFMSNVVKATLAAMAQLAEVRHGSWATAQFQNTVGTSNLLLETCGLKVFQPVSSPEILMVSMENCPSEEAFLEVFDEKGSLVFSQNFRLTENGVSEIALKNALPGGAYFAKVTAGSGSFGSGLLVR